MTGHESVAPVAEALNIVRLSGLASDFAFKCTWIVLRVRPCWWHLVTCSTNCLSSSGKWAGAFLLAYFILGILCNIVLLLHHYLILLSSTPYLQAADQLLLGSACSATYSLRAVLYENLQDILIFWGFVFDHSTYTIRCLRYMITGILFRKLRTRFSPWVNSIHHFYLYLPT